MTTRGGISIKSETMCAHKNGVKGYVFEIERDAPVKPFMGVFLENMGGGLEIYSPLWVCFLCQQDIFRKWGESVYNAISV